ncbi:MAG: formylmethanofuran dehydrogenase subunit A, partial [Gammaproteobacteria bacterium]
RAHVTVYQDHENREIMFARPEFVLKDGKLIVRDGRVVNDISGATHVVHPEYDAGIETELSSYFDRFMTIRKDNVRIADDEIRDGGRGELVVHSTAAST